MTAPRRNPLPREISPGVHWLTDCYSVPIAGRDVHSYHAAYLVAGSSGSALIESGITGGTALILDQLEGVFAQGVPEPNRIFITHSEMAHAGGIGTLLERFPCATVHGDVTDLHLVWPEFAARFFVADPGERFDFGDTEIAVIDGVFRDLPYTRWFFATRGRVLFPGDGFAYSHYHEDGACGCFLEEAPAVDVEGGMKRFTVAAFHWTAYVDIEPYAAALLELVGRQLDAQMIAPAHGLVISSPAETMPRILAGLRGLRDP